MYIENTIYKLLNDFIESFDSYKKNRWVYKLFQIEMLNKMQYNTDSNISRVALTP